MSELDYTYAVARVRALELSLIHIWKNGMRCMAVSSSWAFSWVLCS